MFEVRDPALKLFGRDIPLKSTHIIDSPQVMNSYDKSVNQNDLSEEANGLGNVHKSPTQEVEAEVVDRTKDYKAASRDKDHQEKVLKKPDKVLPCPRCNSLETKFCYFNNYNVNQPRHFCKNCQRYWTAGGTIRNVPVGAGKRKNKHSALPVAPDVVSITHTDSNGLPTASRNIPSFGVEAPLCESLETLLDLKGQKKIEANFITNRDDSEEPSRATESNEKESSENGNEQVGLPQHCNNGFNPLHPIHYYPVPPWAYQWGSCWNSMVFRPSPAYMGSLETASLLAGVRLHTSDPLQTPPGGSLVHWDAHPAYMGSATKMEVPGFIGPTIELPAAPSLYWGIPSPSSSTSNSVCSGTKSPTLGKHSRDVSTQAGDTVKQNLWVPKTLRINDPEEAARSSIWSTLGTKPEQNKPIIKGSVFKSFEPNKSDASSNISNTEEILSANPAALSRSESFQERM